jgi:hypothetical protein
VVQQLLGLFGGQQITAMTTDRTIIMPTWLVVNMTAQHTVYSPKIGQNIVIGKTDRKCLQMSINWTITWPDEPTEPLPTSKIIGEVLEDFLGGFCEELKEERPGHWTVLLKGKCSLMFKRHGGLCGVYNDDRERWFEVWVSDGGITVTTRMQDDVTNCLAAEFAKRCARRWDGHLDEPT